MSSSHRCAATRFETSGWSIIPVVIVVFCESHYGEIRRERLCSIKRRGASHISERWLRRQVKDRWRKDEFSPSLFFWPYNLYFRVLYVGFVRRWSLETASHLPPLQSFVFILNNISCHPRAHIPISSNVASPCATLIGVHALSSLNIEVYKLCFLAGRFVFEYLCIIWPYNRWILLRPFYWKNHDHND